MMSTRVRTMAIKISAQLLIIAGVGYITTFNSFSVAAPSRTTHHHPVEISILPLRGDGEKEPKGLLAKHVSYVHGEALRTTFCHSALEDLELPDGKTIRIAKVADPRTMMREIRRLADAINSLLRPGDIRLDVPIAEGGYPFYEAARSMLGPQYVRPHISPIKVQRTVG